MLSLISLVLSYLPYGVPGLIALWIGIKTEPPKRKPTEDLASLECSTGFATKESWETERKRVRAYLNERKRSKYASVYDENVDVEMRRLYGHAGRERYNDKYVKEFDGPINDPLDLALSQELLPQIVEPVILKDKNDVIIKINTEVGPTLSIYALQDQVGQALEKYGPVAENPHVYYMGGAPLSKDIERDIIKMQVTKHKTRVKEHKNLSLEQAKALAKMKMNPTMYKPEDYIG